MDGGFLEERLPAWWRCWDPDGRGVRALLWPLSLRLLGIRADSEFASFATHTDTSLATQTEPQRFLRPLGIRGLWRFRIRRRCGASDGGGTRRRGEKGKWERGRRKGRGRGGDGDGMGGHGQKGKWGERIVGDGDRKR